VDVSKIMLSPGLEYTLQSMTRGKKYNESIPYSCAMPFYHVSVDHNGDCFLCDCEGWLPIPVGKADEFDSLESIWNSPAAQMLQQDIKEKKYTWCAVEHCGVTQHNIVKHNYQLNIHIDDSCNLACPSCRRDLRMINSGPEFDKKIIYLQKILTWLTNFKRNIVVSLGGTGDPLASQILRPLILNYEPLSTQQFVITTNGLLLKKLMPWSKIKNFVKKYSISIDAASEQVYEHVRRPGKWKNLIENLEWISQNRGNSDIVLNFVVQRDNYQDLPAFVELCGQLNTRGYISPLNDWGTWNSVVVTNPDEYTIKNGCYLDHNVIDAAHPEHQQFIDTLNSIRTGQPRFINISPFFNQFK